VIDTAGQNSGERPARSTSASGLLFCFQTPFPILKKKIRIGEFVFPVDKLEELGFQSGYEVLGLNFNIAGVIADGTIAGQVSQAAITGPAPSSYLLI
jgi:hypothetical protein